MILPNNIPGRTRTKFSCPVYLALNLIFLLFLPCLQAQAQLPSNSELLYSPSVGLKFHEIAYELANSEELTEDQVEQALQFFQATLKLDEKVSYVFPDMIKLIPKKSSVSTLMMLQLLEDYIDENADLEVAISAVGYLLEQLDTREQREELLGTLLDYMGDKNPGFFSELATLAGLLMAERADPNTATLFMMRAYNANKYNSLALEKLIELAPDQIESAMYLEHLRLSLQQNPFNIDAALAFAQYTEQLGLYEIAAEAYQYCAQLFRYYYPLENLPASIYLPWSLSCYNSDRNYHVCVQISEDLRKNGQFDIIAEAIAAKAALKMGNTQKASSIFDTAQEAALANLQSPYAEQIDNQQSKPVLSEIEGIENYQSLAWFYSFALPDANKALDMANKAYSIDPNAPMSAALLAYSLVANGQIDWAKSIIEGYEHNQLSLLALARIQLAEELKEKAIETLKSAVSQDPGSLAAEHAKKLLIDNGSQYISLDDRNTTIATLISSFEDTIVPKFVTPEKLISIQLNLRGSKFSYGSNFGASVVITNNSPEPLIINDNGFLKGNIRVDTVVTGDINENIPSLLSLKVRPGSPIKPGDSFLVPIRLVTGRLRQILLDRPQASLDIEFTLYIDPVVSSDGQVTNRLAEIKPANVAITRPGIKLSNRFLRNRLNSLTKGRQNQKIKISQLFVGLLVEQQAMANQQISYKLMHANWMLPLLKSAIEQSLTDSDWIVKVHTMAAMLALDMDYDLINATAANLTDNYWPCRMMALYLLVREDNKAFKKVLDWTAKYDSNKLVSGMALALGATAPEPEKPTDQPGNGNNDLEKSNPDNTN